MQVATLDLLKVERQRMKKGRKKRIKNSKKIISLEIKMLVLPDIESIEQPQELVLRSPIEGIANSNKI